MSLAMSKDELLEPPEEDALEKSNNGFKDEINGQDEKSTHNDADYTKSSFSTTTTSTIITKDSPLALTPNPYKSTSPSSVAALSFKRFESFRFPLRKSPIEKSSMAIPRLHQYHHHSHHHSLPYNTATATATYAHHLSKAAFDAHHQPLTAKDLVRRVHESISRSNSTSNAVSTTTPANSTFALHNDAKPRHSLFDANFTSFSPTIPQGSKESGSGGSSLRHDIGWVSGRYRRQMGQQRLLRRSESCSNISHHRSSLSFNSSKKALLSLQARRVNKPDAKVHLLPEILTTATTSPVPPSGPAASDDDGLRSGLETPAVTAVLLDTVRTATPHALICKSPALASTSVAKIVATAGTASAAVDYPHDNIDYQFRLPGQDCVVIDGILTELDGTETFPSQTKAANGDEVVVDSKALVPALVDATNFEQGANSTKTAESAEAFGFTPKETPTPLSETNLPTALTAFKIESGPVIDAGEIKRFVKRSHALQELETTEQSYVNDLDVLVHVHLRVLETKSWFNQNVHANLRRCVTGLLALHRNLLSQIQAYKTSEADYEKRAPLTVYSSLEVAFQALSRDHRLYSQFCEVRMRTVNEINRAVGQSTITGMQKESKELMAQQGRPKSRTDLKDHLIKPIQRICRYPLLLKEILRLTGSGDPEYEFIERAYECMKALAQQMDENQRITERKLLTEQFLKKLPETNFPRKSGIAAPLHSAATLSHSNSTDSHHQHNHHRQGSGNAIHPLPSSGAHGPSEELFEGGPFGEGILPGSLSKAYASTLGSIVLAGALEYVIMPDMPTRLRYYGCFLFESMLLVVKAKKTSLYEPRQWLPLRLCELYETTRLDGYTRFGWRIMYDQFRIDFGASCEAERQAWMTTLRTHIQAAKLAHARIPQNAAALETVVSSLPWNMARPSSLPSSSSMGSLVASGSSRHVQVHHQPPSPTPSPWSTCSSAIPSPLMPPPPMGASPTSSTMMMAMSFMTSTGEPEKWNDRGTSGVSLDAYAQYYEHHIHPHSYEPTSAEPYDPSRLALTHHLSVESNSDTPHGYGMAGNQPSNNASNCNHQDQSCNPLNRSLSQPRTRPSNEFNPLSAKKSESTASGASHLLFPSTPFPWLVPDPRPRSHSFDVTRVFASSHSGIKPNQRTLVQSMFKDVSTENIWTTTTTVTTASYHSQHSPQPVSASLSSPMTSRVSRHSTPMPFSYFNSNSASSSNTAAGNVLLHPPTSPKATTGMVASTSGNSLSTAGSVAVSGAGEDDETPAPTTTLQSAGSCSSLTSRLMRRKNSGASAKGSPNGHVPAPSEKTEWDRRRSSATAAIAATLNFRKNFDPNTHNHVQHHRRRLSIPDLFNSNGDHPTVSGVAPPTRDGGSIYQWISVKARAQVIEKKATHGLTPSFASAPLLAGSRNKSKKGGGLAGGRLKASQSSQDLSSSFSVDASSLSSSLASLAMPGTSGENLATSLLGVDLVADGGILDSLSSAAGEAARSRRGNGSSERIQRRSLGAALMMTSIDRSFSTAAQSSTSSSIASTSTAAQGLRPSSSTQSLPVYLESNNSSTHSLVDSHTAGDSAHKDSAVEKIWMAMGRLTHRRSAGDRHDSSSSNKSHQRQNRQHKGYTQTSNQSSSSIAGEGGDKAGVAGSPRPFRWPSIHASDSSSLTMVYNSEDASPVTGSSMGQTDASGRNHHRTVSGSTVQSMDSATSIMSNGSVPNHLDMMSFSPSSVPRLTLTPSGSVRSRSSSNSSVHSSPLSIHDQPKSSELHYLHYQHHHHNKPQHPDTQQLPLLWPFSEEHNLSENALTGGMAIGTSSPRSTSTSPCHHSGGSGSRKSISSSSASSLSPTLHYNQDPYQLQPSVLHDRSSSVTKVPISFQEGYAPVPFPHTLHLDPNIQDRRKSSSILQNLTQASQKFKTMIRPPAGMRRRTVMNISPVTMDHHNSVGVAGGGISIELRSDSTGDGVLTELLEDEVGSMGLSGEEIDVGPLVSERDMEEIFGADRVANDAV
ncbi:hypothetical protein EC957_000842 [Mortierella hygrophila]|uniref:DH domain-containing protein n=1 Tax=Mortierella hygrophila TaxID=979708 RepID=A0A9P6F5K9_9FUNG|nr:hypothetical protein EC957_000842 [Mortierella hygrophila]